MFIPLFVLSAGFHFPAFASFPSIANFDEKSKFSFIIHEIFTISRRKSWYNGVRHYTCADLRSTKGRTTTANRVHPAEHSMSEGHGIMA